MSDGEKKPWQPKSRLPFGQEAAPAAGSGAKIAVMLIYAFAFFGMAGAAAFMMLSRGAPFTSPQALVPSVGALWFLIRFIMVARPKRNDPLVR